MDGVKEFERWLRHGKAGEHYLYHAGLLVVDRRRKPEVGRVANRAWKAYTAGDVNLVQTAHGSEYLYFAQKRRKSNV